MALDGLDLTVATGEIYGLLGPNGAGKTTLLRAIIGLLRPSAGTLSVLGQRPGSAAVRASVGYMTQTAAVYPELTVRQNVNFFGRVFGASSADCEAALEVVDLADRRDSVVAELSGGMRQRVSLACAIVHRPRLLLLDEPTVGVDPVLRAQFWSYFRRLAAGGVTILVSSHVMDEAERCDRLGLMRLGRLLAEGTAAELRRAGHRKDLEAAFLVLASRVTSA
ncbi:MAG: ABC transporter ATP-binding protein [Candidatus Dormibacteria bacterium]